MDLAERAAPYAIATWDFSWLERRYDGGGYEDWDRALDELTERGYDAVRIDPYPHFVASDPTREWTLPPAFAACDWGAPDVCRIRVMPALVEFVEKCAERDVDVALSSWFRVDETRARMDIEEPTDLAAVWAATLDRLDDAGLLDAICWVDLCNEFPQAAWAPFFEPEDEDAGRDRESPDARRWVADSIGALEEAYPDLPYCLSDTAGSGAPWGRTPVDGADLLEVHLWLMNTTSFYPWELKEYGVDSEEHFEWLGGRGEERYREDPEGWKAELATHVETAADWSRRTGLPLATTECWGPVHYRDDPDLDWDWVKDVCAFGTRRAAETGRWGAIATSNFCGPQFSGMWDDVGWHRELTDEIRSAPLDL